MEPPLKNFNGKKSNGYSCGHDNLIEEEVAMHNYPLKSRN
jgi:hypothetical protein